MNYVFATSAGRATTLALSILSLSAVSSAQVSINSDLLKYGIYANDPNLATAYSVGSNIYNLANPGLLATATYTQTYVDPSNLPQFVNDTLKETITYAYDSSGNLTSYADSLSAMFSDQIVGNSTTPDTNGGVNDVIDFQVSSPTVLTYSFTSSGNGSAGGGFGSGTMIFNEPTSSIFSESGSVLLTPGNYGLNVAASAATFGVSNSPSNELLTTTLNFAPATSTPSPAAAIPFVFGLMARKRRK